MAQRKYKPTTPSTRQRTVDDFQDVTTDKPCRALTKGHGVISGRNNQGRVTVRWRGGGHKRRYREIDFKRNKDSVSARVESIEYDPNRNCRIALLCYQDGERRYILAPTSLKKGSQVSSGESAEFVDGNCLPLEKIPLGTSIHNIELKPGGGGQMVRSAGGVAQLIAREGKYASVRLPSGETRKVHIRCRATIGQLSNIEHANLKLGKAGRSRWLGRMPNVRGVAMNPVDHPLGGGEGRTAGGRHPVTPWGKPTKGYKTRRRRHSDKMIVRRRNQKGAS